VVVHAETNRPDRLDFSQETLTFTPDNWDTVQKLQVTAVEDNIHNNDPDMELSFRSTSVDEDYDREWASFSGTIENNDTAALEISRTSGLVTHEGGGWDTFSVRLATEPELPVIVSVTTDDETEGRVAGIPLTFTPQSYGWRLVRVTGVTDTENDAPTPYTVSIQVALTLDAAYLALPVSTVSLINEAEPEDTDPPDDDPPDTDLPDDDPPDTDLPDTEDPDTEDPNGEDPDDEDPEGCGCSSSGPASGLWLPLLGLLFLRRRR
jgi:MYXO-CTERM domain-containing protein